MAISAVKSDNVCLAEKVAEKVAKYIQDNKMQKGDRLPNERELTELLNVSRSTIREAMRALSMRGVVVIRQGSGTYIANLPGVAEDPFGLDFKYDKVKVITDLLEIRSLLEPAVASLSAKRATEEDKRELCRLADAIAENIKAGVDHTEYDAQFHCRIAKSTDNDVLMVMFPEIVKGVKFFTQVLEDRIIRDVIDDHRRIADAITGGDSQAAFEAMRAHIERNKVALEAWSREQQ